MTRIGNEPTFTVKCKGGMSFNCHTQEHERGDEYRCQTCRIYVGCNRCTQIPQEIVCLRCHDWALPAGEQEHGRMMRKGNLPEAVRNLFREVTDKIGNG